MGVEAIEPLAVFTDYRDLVVALRPELGTHMTAVGEVAGLPTGYTARSSSLVYGRSLRSPPSCRPTSAPKGSDRLPGPPSALCSHHGGAGTPDTLTGCQGASGRDGDR
jgi:hypothetical protein